MKIRPEDIVDNPVQSVVWAEFMKESEACAGVQEELQQKKNVVVVLLKNETRVAVALSQDFPAEAIHLARQNNPYPQFRLASDLRIPVIAYLGWKSTDTFNSPSESSIIREE